jgi:acyl-CoA synthetase (NDP forming)
MTLTVPAQPAVDVGALLSARNVVIVGASDRSAWSRVLHRNLRASPGLERLWLVNPTGAPAHGEPTLRSPAMIDGDVDLACIAVGADRVLEALRSIVERGVRTAIVIASGFAEAGAKGARLSDDLRDYAVANGVTILGPNTAGMVNIAGGVYPLGATLMPPGEPGSLAIVTQSGGVVTHLLRLSVARGVAANAIYGVGNELVLRAVDVVRHHLYDDQTKVVALYLEGIRDPQAFIDVAAEAAEVGKPIVVMKVGRSERGKHMVASHTGAMVGDDQVVDVALRQLGVVRVDSLDELIATAGLLAHAPRLAGRRIAAVSGSGATCAMMADRASTVGLELVDFAPETVQAIAAVLPPGAPIHNPLDVTGAVVGDIGVAADSCVAAADDPNVDLVVCQFLVADRFAPDLEPAMVERAAKVAEGVAAATKPVILMGDVPVDLSPELRSVLRRSGLYVSRGLDLTMGAVASSVWWSQTAPGVRLPDRPLRSDGPPTGEPTLLGQREAHELLDRFGVPVLPSVLAVDAAAAVAAARAIGYPVVAKLEADQVAHKTDIGGVELGLSDDSQVRAAFNRIFAHASAAAVPPETIKGVVMTPMRTGGVELIVSVDDVSPWGTMLTVGLGGIWVELLHDVVSRLLPATTSDVLSLLRSLRGHTVLEGGRGSKPANLQRVAEVITDIVAAAVDLGPRLHGIEINPLLVDGDEVSVLDVLVLTRP